MKLKSKLYKTVVMPAMVHESKPLARNGNFFLQKCSYPQKNCSYIQKHTCNELPAVRRVDGVCMCAKEDETRFDGTRSFDMYFERSLSLS